jgi:hypothetical protein
MATCPRCMGYLGEHHKCPGCPFRRLANALVSVLGGALLGGALCFAFDEHAAPALFLAAAALGGVLASAVRQAVSGGPR